MRHRLRLTPLFAVLSFAVASPAFADYKQFYRQGVLALDARKYDEALSNFRRASDENPLEGGDLVEIAPGRKEPYLPLFQIGLVYYRRGECARASGSWMAARMSGEVLEHASQARVMQEGLAACSSGSAKPTTAASPAPTAATPRPTPSSPPAATPAATPAAPDRTARVARLLQDARTELAAGRLSAARSRLEDARKVGAADPDLDDVRKSIAASESAAARVDEEWRAVEAFLGLDYARAKDLLEPLYRAGTLSPRGHLYLACSHAATALLAGQTGEAELREARDVFGKARASGTRFDADWRYISPRLRALLEKSGS